MFENDARVVRDKSKLLTEFQDNYHLILNKSKAHFHDEGDAAWRTGLAAATMILIGDDEQACHFLEALRDNCWVHGEPVRYPKGEALNNPLSRDQYITQMMACLLSFTCSRNQKLRTTAKELMSKFLQRLTSNNMQLSNHDAGYLPYPLQFLTHRVAEIMELPSFKPSIKAELDNIRARAGSKLRDHFIGEISSSMGSIKVKGHAVPKDVRDRLAATIADHIIIGNMFKAAGSLGQILDELEPKQATQSIDEWFQSGIKQNISDSLHDKCRFRVLGVLIGPPRSWCDEVATIIARVLAAELYKQELPYGFTLKDLLEARADPHPLHAIYALYSKLTAKRIASGEDSITGFYQTHLLFCQLFMLMETNRQYFANHMSEPMHQLAASVSKHNMALLEILSAQTASHESSVTLNTQLFRKYVENWNPEWENTDYVWQQDIAAQRRDRAANDTQIAPLAYMLMRGFYEHAFRLKLGAKAVESLTQENISKDSDKEASTSEVPRLVL